MANHKPIIYDTTQREGVQRKGSGGNEDVRAAVATLTAEFLKTCVIELGMPANSVDRSLISKIIDKFKRNERIDKNKVAIGFLCRCVDFDIEQGAKFFESYPNNIMHLFIGTSEEHRKTRFGGSLGIDGYCELIKEKVRYAATMPSIAKVMFTPEDTIRTYREGKGHLTKLLDALIEGYTAGNQQIKRICHPIVNIADTVGCSHPSEISEIVSFVGECYKDKLDISVHFHNDLDMATANTYEAFLKGSTYIQVCWNGSAERNGLAKLEPIVAKLVLEGHLVDSEFVSDKNLSKLTNISKLVSLLYGWDWDENLAVVGANANVSTAGIHSNLTTKNIKAYHITGERFGNKVTMSFCSTSGSTHLKALLQYSGFKFDVNDENIIRCTEYLKELANERQSDISESECIYYAEIMINNRVETSRLIINNYEISTNRNNKSTSIKITGSYHNQEFEITREGVGPVDAMKKCLAAAINKENEQIELVEFRTKVKLPLNLDNIQYENLSNAIGTDAYLQCVCGFSYKGRVYYGMAVNENSSLAECEAIIDAVKKMIQIVEWEGL